MNRDDLRALQHFEQVWRRVTASRPGPPPGPMPPPPGPMPPPPGGLMPGRRKRCCGQRFRPRRGPG